MPVGQKLKALRNVRNITVREVELESRRIAEAKGDKRFYISNGWLAKLENDPVLEPSLCKLFSLSTIYHVEITELLRLYNVDAEERDKYYAIADPNKTLLLSEVPEAYRTIELLKTLVSSPNETTLLPQAVLSGDERPDVPIPNPDSEGINYGYIGLDDFNMYPLIRPGSFVRIDTRRSKLRPLAGRSDYKRPIYFVELRDRYACGWCELQGNQLLIVPHHSSPGATRRLTNLKEAEIVGRVTGFNTRCVDVPFDEYKIPKDKYGYIGLKDFTMHPLIRPGAFVRIDTYQDKLRAASWHNEYERPIYFIELRDAYACGCCELQDNQLIIIPHHSSPRATRRLTYLKDAEIVGRVTGFDTSCV